MSEPLRVLLVEDSEDDMELLLEELRRGGFSPICERVEEPEAMDRVLGDRPWDIVISDWTIPSFGALPALSLFRGKGLDIPFLVVSGTIGEEKAVEAMRAGAHDFVLKDRLSRLVPAVRRELGEAALRAEQRRLAERLRVSEEALVRSEKLRALGQMAAGVSHDLKNILNPLSLHLQFLRRAVGRGQSEDARTTIEDMDAVLRRGVETIERLRRFSRKAAPAGAVRVKLNRLAHEAIEIGRPRMASRSGAMCVIREEFGEPPPMLATEEEVLSSIVNLVVNAIDALKDGGTITVRTRAVRGGASVEVEDDGPGMPPEVAARVSEPFFTTKGEEGTGLGLAMVRDCVARHGGSLSLDTAPGRGAKFELWFPAAPVE